MRQTIRRFFIAAITGGVATYAGMKFMTKAKPSDGLDSESHELINTYVHQHKLGVLMKQSLLNGYMQLNHAFLDYGLRQKMSAFSFYENYFQRQDLKEEGHKQKIKQTYCIFSPKEQLCGHPGITHGGASATIVDQNSGFLAMIYTLELCATAQLQMKYKKPIKKGLVYVFKGVVSKRQGRDVHINSQITDLETGEVVVEAYALMKTVQWEHKMAEVFKFLFHSKDQTEPEKQVV